jgi:serine/threonine protein phosphatase 1
MRRVIIRYRKYWCDMSLTYVIPDLHGRFDLLRDALAKIADHAAGNSGLIVALGDYVDKGPDSKRIIERLRFGALAGWGFVPLKGNHDAMMVEALRHPAKMAAWIEKGGDTALQSYGGSAAAVPQADIAWLDGLRLMHIDAHRVYVHAGVDPDLPLDRQPEEVLLWKRYPKGYAAGFENFHVVHGHDNFPEGPLLYEGRSNLDTAAWRTGRLVIGVFDDAKAGGPVDFIVVRGPAAGRL